MYRNYQYQPSYGFEIKSLFTPAVTWLVISNVIIFILYLFLKKLFDKFLILFPKQVIEDYYLWQPITYMFLHINAGHVFGNLLMLIFIGGYVERSMGTPKFIWFYLFVGVASGILYTIVVFLVKVIFGNTLLYGVGMLGASGAVLGVVMVACLMNWDSNLWIFGIVPIKGKWLIFLLTALAVLGTISSFKGRECVSHLGHLSGLLIAYLYFEKPFGKWKKLFKKKRKAKSVFEEEHFHLHND